MTAPRIPLFQRKGAPSAAGKPAVSIHIGGAPQTSNSDSPGPGGEGNSAADDQPKDVTCPKCGCEFNADTGEIKGGQDAGPSDVGNGGGLPPGLAAALGGG